MRAGYDVCILKGQKWEVYSFFEEHEKADATHLAQHIQNNHKAVCVLWHSKMQVTYYYNRETGSNKNTPKYRDIRQSLKLEMIDSPKKKVAPPQSAPAIRHRAPAPAPLFKNDEHKRTFISTIGTLVFGVILSIIIPVGFMAEAATSVKVVAILFGLLLSIIVAIGIYIAMVKDDANKQVTSSTAQQPNRPTQNNQTPLQDLADIDTSHLEGDAPSAEEAEQEDDYPDISEDELAENIKQAESQQTLIDSLNPILMEIKEARGLTETDGLSDAEAQALSLYCVGAAQAICDYHKYAPNVIATTLPLALTRINISPSQTSSVIEHLTDYMCYTPLKKLVEQGVTDTKSSLGDSSAIFMGVDSALTTWSKDRERDGITDHYRFASVLMTRIIPNPNRKTKKQIQDTLSAHNEIVNKVLAECHGTEIIAQDTGITALFTSPKDAVKAGSIIEKTISHLSASLPDAAFDINVSITTGDILEQNNALQGRSANLATAILNTMAESGAVYTCKVTKDICVAHNAYTFKKASNIDLAGFGSPDLYILNQ